MEQILFMKQLSTKLGLNLHINYHQSHYLLIEKVLDQLSQGQILNSLVIQDGDV